MRAGLLPLLFALCSVGSTFAAAADEVFDGVWEGTLELVGEYGADKVRGLPEGADRTAAQLQLRDDEVRFELGGRRITPDGGFRIAKHDAAALVYATQRQRFAVETWQLSLTKLDADTALVFVWQVGTTKDSDPNAHGFSASSGVSRSVRRARSFSRSVPPFCILSRQLGETKCRDRYCAAPRGWCSVGFRSSPQVRRARRRRRS